MDVQQGRKHYKCKSHTAAVQVTMDMKLVLLIVGLLGLLQTPVEADYIWHYDEIPYDSRASCKRSTSYYSNSITANNTDIDVATDIDSLLDYSNSGLCYYCVCSVDGTQAGCISRDAWYCEYYRILRTPGAPEYRYRQLFKQDRPPYFRQLSYRLRRTMEDGIVTLYNAVGDGSLNNGSCVPFVSEYSDCTEANYCSGCSRCICTEAAEWSCEKVFMCPVNEEDASSDQDTITTGLDVMYTGLKDKEKKKPRILVPPPPTTEDQLIVTGNDPLYEDFETFLSRQKRSLKEESKDKSNKNHTIKFFHTVDEINEDTLKNSNKSGTIEAKKEQVKRIPKISRRTGLVDNFNNTNLSSLHIEYNQPQDYDHHISENKIDAGSHAMNRINDNDFHKLIGNETQSLKDKHLSKVVVNELKAGEEIIGDKDVSPTSNITFTSENDTLNAMAYIAGNLLSKLWDMEKDASDDSIETEVLKHEKINDLLELFKDPLSIRQETFLKNALEKLSDTLNRNKNVKNVSICETISEPDLALSGEEKDGLSVSKKYKTKCNDSKIPQNVNEQRNQNNISLNVVSKLNNVLGLVKEFENVQNKLKNLKDRISSEQLNDKDVLNNERNVSFNIFGSLLNKITKLIIPNPIKSKKIASNMKRMNQFGGNFEFNKVFQKKFNVKLDRINMTTKDKLVLDYLKHIENNPRCLFKNNIQEQLKNVDLNIEGNILYNLSEFFKIKSIIDLINLKDIEHNSRSTTQIPEEITTLKTSLRNSGSDTATEVSNTKKKLKNHLKALLEDLLQLQKEHGVNNNKSLNIIEALPCIFNILNNNKISDPVSYEQSSKKSNTFQETHIDKMKTIIETLKTEFATNTATRRNNLMSQETPKSARIWARVIKNINNFQFKTRRSSNFKISKTYAELKKIMENVEVMGNTYKNFAIFSVIPPHKRLMLLKTLEADTKLQSNALDDIYNSIDVINKLSADKRDEIREFVDNVENNIRLSARVLKNYRKFNGTMNKNSDTFVLASSSKSLNNDAIKLSKLLHVPKENKGVKTSFKLSRDQILSQLMLNRVQYYLRTKEAKDLDLHDDINYNIGKKILLLIQSGNLNVAKELFGIFLSNKRKEDNLQRIKDTTTTNHYAKRKPLLLALKEPLIKFDDPGKEIDVQIKDNLYKNFNI